MARPVGTPNLEDNTIRTIIMMNESGSGVSEIARTTGISRPTIYKYLNQND
jgi:DNA invertase Pin-like site-specific DNA recombinase